MFCVRVHGRGGQGGKVSARVLGRAGFLEGLFVQDFPVFGAERRGAPVSDFVRVSEQPILERGYVEEPDAVLVLDETLLGLVDVRAGLKGDGFVLVNSSNKLDGERTFVVDATLAALEAFGKPIPNIALLGAFAKLQKKITLEKIIEATKRELGDKGISSEVIEKNVEAARKCFEAMETQK
ncbi:2-oxoacid:acceptor oxidoreductase family protein [Candidatus Micrarchaeota archaeon]|nr:2-oxoacid:acceptor oxidoreductase family protein [Candidatus Micrarchaeota archaeon]